MTIISVFFPPQVFERCSKVILLFSKRNSKDKQKPRLFNFQPKRAIIIFSKIYILLFIYLLTSMHNFPKGHTSTDSFKGISSETVKDLRSHPTNKLTR